ncbi:conjugal transfer protein TraG [Hyphomonas sp. CACIAM 19H1]|uniref:IncP-type conjugal transfer protein TraG n=1 Tax=Hyphomonas sp. CACIAM 19H1 TaxID=1873716 RepID=UPI000DEDEF12|nr:IncP-type conjugal transfer protein TraG [Hyphomonas sp. CACIAM 19H1]AXE63599.1 conjugal transfer protein TraG [Hyphomonas sp. CACIAM 19H1]
MNPGKILIGQVGIVLIVIVMTNWYATQWAASALAYSGALGAPWFRVGDQPVYFPWRLFQWWYAYEGYAPVVFAKAGLMAASGGVFGILVAVIGSVIRSRDARFVTTYGSARWANAKDVGRHKLRARSGVFLGRYGGRYLRHAGPEHVMAFAPTRSGKGVGLVVPTLLSWTGSAVIHDIKGENWTLTSGWRSTFSDCIRFDPTNPKSPRFNPLLEVRRGAWEVRDAQNIADILVDPEGSLERRNHWEKTAHALLVGVILHVLYAEDDKTLSGCARFLSDPDRTFAATLRRMMATLHLGTCPHPVVAQAAQELQNKSENERSGVLSTALSFLSLYRDPIVAEVTSVSDWRIEDLVGGARPLSLYLACPPSDVSRTKPLMRLVLNQIARRLTEQEPDPSRRKLLLMLDEFPALGRIDFFESALAFMAGYGVRAFLVAQSLNQIEKAYGPNNAILDNCHVRVAFATNDERTAKRISEALGTKTELRSQKNYTGHRLAPWLSHMMVSRQETQRALMTPGEIMQLPATDEIVMVSGVPPVRAKKLRYFEDGNFLRRVLPAASPDRAEEGGPQDWGHAGSRKSGPGGQGGGGGAGSVGGLMLEPELGPVQQDLPGIDRSEAVPDVDEESPFEEDPQSRTIRRANGLDKGGSDFLPDF